MRLKQIATSEVDFTVPHQLLFCGKLLLVADWTDATRSHAIVSFRASGDALTERRVLLDAQHNVAVFDWTFAGDRLVLLGVEHFGDLLVHDFV